MWLPLVAAFAAEWPPLDPPPGPADRGADAAVVVGIDAYPFLDDVPGARANAEDWFRYLTRTRGLSPARVHLLRDVEATREKVLKELGRAAAEVGPDGTVWFVFVGHGAPSVDGRDGVLVGADAQPDPDSLYARSVPRSEVLAALEGRQALLVLDTCFSGRSGQGALVPDLQFVVPTWATAHTAATVLTAGSATQFAGPLAGSGRPAFSYLVLGAALGWGDANADGQVTAAEATAWAREAIGATVRGREQTPELHGPDRPLGPSVGRPAPDLVELALGGPSRPVPERGVLPAAELEARREAVEARAQAARREEEALRAAEADARRRLDEAATALLDQARAEVEALAPRMAANDPTATLDARAFVTRYTGARVEEGELVRTVDVPELPEVLSWLARDRPGTASVTAPRRHVHWMSLWKPTHPWRQGLGTEPLSIFDPFDATLASAGHLSGEYRGDRPITPDDVQPLLDLSVDAAAYGEAWFAGDAERRKGLEYALIGLTLEARDLSTALRQGRFHVEAYGAKPGDELLADHFGERDALLWLVEEVRVRAADAEGACEREEEALDALAAGAGAWLREVHADPIWLDVHAGRATAPKSWSTTFLGYGKKLHKLAQQVHACSGT